MIAGGREYSLANRARGASGEAGKMTGSEAGIWQYKSSQSNFTQRIPVELPFRRLRG